MFCHQCGSTIEDNSNFCVHCGAAIGAVPPSPPPVAGVPHGYQQKSKIVAGLLQIFLGSFGVGRFYLGYTGIGVAQILVSWLTCGIGAIWPLIDGILIISGSVPVDANNIPLKD